jgi:hypothetical protein
MWVHISFVTREVKHTTTSSIVQLASYGGVVSDGGAVKGVSGGAGSIWGRVVVVVVVVMVAVVMVVVVMVVVVVVVVVLVAA